MDTIVVGGGAIGLAVAWRSAAAGLAMEVVDPQPGRGASWAAAGMLAPVTEAHYGEDALLALNLASNRRWPSFAAELAEASGRDPGYRETGTLVVARDADDNAALTELFTFQQGLGLAVQRLSASETRRREPGLSPRVRGGIAVEGDHSVDNRALIEALLAACQRAGVTLRRERVAAVDVDTDRVAGVTLATGEHLRAGTVVLAAGCGSATLAGLPDGVVPPVRPVKGQLLHLRGAAVPPLTTRTIRGLDVYVVPRADGRVVVGATVEEQGRDTRVTAGGVFELLRAAVELLPGVSEYELTETVAGLRPGSPDNAPLLGRAAVDGLVLATGHYRNGILLAPVTGDAIARLLAGEEPELIAAFSPLRFPAVPAEVAS